MTTLSELRILVQYTEFLVLGLSRRKDARWRKEAHYTWVRKLNRRVCYFSFIIIEKKRQVMFQYFGLYVLYICGSWDEKKKGGFSYCTV